MEFGEGDMQPEQIQSQLKTTTLDSLDHQAHGSNPKAKTRSSHEMPYTPTMTNTSPTQEKKIHGDIARCYMWGVTKGYLHTLL